MSRKKLESLKKPKKSKWGGARPGSGRKPQPDYKARMLFKKAWDQTMTYDDLVKMVESAKKNKWLFKLLLEQRIGKPAQGIEMSGKGGKPVEFKVMLDEGKSNSMAK